MWRTSPIFVLALALAGCNGAITTLGPSLTAQPTEVAIQTEVPSLTVVPIATEGPNPTEEVPACPVAEATVLRVAEAGSSCFGNRELSVAGWLDLPPDLGFEGPLIKPSWLAYPPNWLSALWAVEPRHGGEDGGNGCPQDVPCAWFFLHVRPGSGLELPAAPRWIRVSGHFFDPAAEMCHYEPDASDPYEYDDELARVDCRAHFVITSIMPSAGPE